MQTQYYNRGLISFCQRKSVNLKKAVSLFLEHYKIQGDNKDSIIQENWDKFANFVDKSIKNGTLKGEAISLAGDTYKIIAQEKKAYYEIMQSYSKEQLEFWNKVKEEAPNYSTLSKFFILYNLYLPKNADSQTKLGKILPKFEALKDSNLLEVFMKYIPTESKRSLKKELSYLKHRGEITDIERIQEIENILNEKRD